MHIGLRTLGGDPGAFYRLDLDEMIDVLAVLRLEQERREAARPQRRGASMPPRVNYASEEAREFWSPAFRS